LNINCAQPAGSITATFRDTGQKIVLLDNGKDFDQIAGDGVYSIRTRLTNHKKSIVFLDFPDGDQLEIRLKPTYVSEMSEFVERTLSSADIISISRDGFSVVVPPFPIQFAGESHQIIYVYQNGMLGFTLPRILGIPNFVNLQLPNKNYEAMIVPFWSDLETDYGQIVSQTFGELPNREFVIEWQNVTPYLDATQDGATFQLVFYENSNDIRFNFKDVTFADSIFSEGATATVGLQISSSLGFMHSYDNATIRDQSSLLWKYYPSSILQAEKGAPGNKSSSSSSGGFGGLLWLTFVLLGFYWRTRYSKY
jgi:hypothetical protein